MMFAGLLTKIGFGFASRWTSAMTVALVLACAGISFWRGMAAIESMVETARTEAFAARDAHWKLEIEKSNAAVEKTIAENAIAAAEASSAAEQTISGLRAALTELETKNASLPDGGRCGLDAGRVRLLDPSR